MKEFRQIEHEFNPKDLATPPAAGFNFFQGIKTYKLNTKDNKFNKSNAWIMSNMAWLVYIKDKKYIKTQLKQAGFFNTKFFDCDGSQAFITYTKKVIIVAFRGTEPFDDPIDILTDMNFIPTKWKLGGYVHNGFKSAFYKIWFEIKKELNKSKNLKIYWAGHSLGGALAHIAASEYGGECIYTIGCPRVGSRKFINTIKIPSYRVVNMRDIVPKIPPIFPFMYRHVGDTIYIDHIGNLLINPPWFNKLFQKLGGSWIAILFFLINSVWGSRLSIILNYISDHNPQNYTAKLWNAIPEKKF